MRVRPRDAAGLVVLRRTSEGLSVLLGRRHRRARFLPGVFVFPGGGLERQDRMPSGFPEEFAAAPGGLDTASRHQLPALVRCALRETWEETGVLPGRRIGTAPAHCRSEAWQAYAAAGVAPPFAAVRLLGRAITPTDSPIRFHTRFFLLEADAIVATEPRDRELEDVGWIPVDAAAREEMIDVTRFMLDRAITAGASDPAPLFRYRGDDSLVIEGERRSLWRLPD